LYQDQFQVTIDRAFRSNRNSVELNSTANCVVPGSVLS